MGILVLSGGRSRFGRVSKHREGREGVVISDHRVSLFAPPERVEGYRAQLLDFMETHVYPAEPVYEVQVRESGNPHHHPQIVEDLAPEACNCNAPDTGNMEVLTLFGTDEHKERWLRPLLDGTIRSAFAMTEPAVASSDATNIELRMDRNGGGYLLNGHRRFASNAMHANCRVLIVMGRTDPSAAPHRQQSMVVVPIDASGIRIVRILPMFGSERALELLCQRADSWSTFGSALSERANIRDWVAEARIEIEKSRLLILKAAWLMDVAGNREAKTEIAAIKVDLMPQRGSPVKSW